MANETLARAFGFAGDELQVNRAGRLTPRQAEMLAGIDRRLRRFGALATVAFGLTVLVMTVPVVLAVGPSNVLAMPMALAANLMAVSLMLAIFLVAQMAGHARSRDVRSGRVSIAEGPAHLTTKRYRRSIGTAYYVTLGDTRFQVAAKRQFEAFTPGAAYRAFYIHHPPTHHILSVERMG